MNDSHSASYAAAGVDVTAGYEAVNRIKPLVESTYIPGVMGTLGGCLPRMSPVWSGLCWFPAPTGWAPSSSWPF